MENSALQKQILFDRRTSKTIWTRIESLLGIDIQQARRMMMKTSDFMRLLYDIYQ
jgi:hypothetical protein